MSNSSSVAWSLPPGSPACHQRVKGEMKIQIPLDSEEKGQIVKEKRRERPKGKMSCAKEKIPIPLIFPAS